ncbi:hypothetical protein SODALDRAFT_329750 [Sodiomyces alkalinus F11]|uniref:Uncharacterized protein n=1 Tax=Sodiomyces alkalinus (strain CBS 110278 / VKM F-3762 / F11) TaxID=1314773 RepID=A0A3N2PJK3_SODAK|nr:hypothetical protein SODALDRAFT_329750 [Sodiomyces alkalinus F11]ROT34496.1 hypothetical protein SODALDRAFT_329750 [Sodiomyces alkalinus F11]
MHMCNIPPISRPLTILYSFSSPLTSTQVPSTTSYPSTHISSPSTPDHANPPTPACSRATGRRTGAEQAHDPSRTFPRHKNHPIPSSLCHFPNVCVAPPRTCLKYASLGSAKLPGVITIEILGPSRDCLNCHWRSNLP